MTLCVCTLYVCKVCLFVCLFVQPPTTDFQAELFAKIGGKRPALEASMEGEEGAASLGGEGEGEEEGEGGRRERSKSKSKKKKRSKKGRSRTHSKLSSECCLLVCWFVCLFVCFLLFFSFCFSCVLFVTLHEHTLKNMCILRVHTCILFYNAVEYICKH